MPELVFGYHFRWTANGDHEQFSADRGGPCADACRVAALLQLGESINPSLESCRGFALVDDRLSVLHYETRTQRCRTMGRPDEEGRMLISRFILSDYQERKDSPHRVRVRVSWLFQVIARSRAESSSSSCIWSSPSVVPFRWLSLSKYDLVELQTFVIECCRGLLCVLHVIFEFAVVT